MFLSEPRFSGGLAPAQSDWGEAWRNMAGASDETQRVIENNNADGAALRDIYDARNARIHEVTGVQLENPYRLDFNEAAARMMKAGRKPTDAVADAEGEWLRRARELAEQHPENAAELLADIQAEKNSLLREAKQAFDTAAADPALGTAGRWSAIILGGLKGAARDPYQWALATLGGGAGFGRTVAARIGTVMLSEAAVNAGGEYLLQQQSQERKAAAGLDHGPDDIFRNVAIAATFGSVFGGSVQGLAELSRLFKFGAGENAALKRVAEGAPEPADLPALAAATGRPMSPEEAGLATRAIEEDALDRALLPAEPTPRDVALMDSALRHAEDPDGPLPPELAERVMDDPDAPTRPRSMTLAEYERLYGLEPLDAPEMDARATLRPSQAAEPLDDAAMREAEELAGDIGEPTLDANGNAQSTFDFAPIMDGDGNVRLAPPREALDAADEDNFLADVLEACKL